MSDHTHGDIPAPGGLKIDKAFAGFLLILAIATIWDTPRLPDLLMFTGLAFLNTLPFIVFAVMAVGYLKASGAENVIAKAFEGKELRMILLAAAFGGLSPFCSCEVIPFIAALLALGAPLSAVMAFWLSSPLMDPAMFAITAGNLGLDFAIAKAVAAIGLGLFGGFGVMALSRAGWFAQPLRETPIAKGCGCGPAQPFSQQPRWAFWKEPERRGAFRETAWDNAIFLGKWLLLAYLIEAIMVTYIPADMIARYLGGEGFQPILMGALLGGPAYLNGYAAVPMVAGLLDQGMSPGGAMAFVLAGGVSCIPAALAIWALVKPQVFLSYLGFAMVGSLIAGSVWALLA